MSSWLVRARWWGVGAAGMAFVLIVAGLVLQLMASAPADLSVGDRVAPATMAMFAVVGAVLVARRPDHPFSWIMVAFAALQATNGVSSGIVVLADGPGRLVDVVAWVGSWAWVPAITCLAVGLLVFPDGRLASPRWRYAMGLEVAALAGVAVLAVTLWPHRGPALLDAGDQWPGVAGTVGAVLLPVVLAGFVAALVSLVVRYRRAGGIVRQQLKWLLFAVALLGTAIVLAALSDLAGFGQQWWQDLFGVTGLFFLPVSVAFAVLRYRLFDIDRIVGRTVSYALLTAVLVAVYALGVVGVGALLPGERSDLLVAGSTLAVAALFQPLRLRIQAWVDRRFNRSRYDAAHTVETFGARMRDEVDLASLLADLRRAVTATVQPGTASIWIRATGE